jgi:uncharacterized membrane protein
MALADSIRFCCCVKTAIATAVAFTALMLAGLMPAWAAEQPTASPAEASARTNKAASRKNKNEVGLSGHGFVRDGDVFTTIDAPGAGAFTVVFGIDENGTMVGGYVDRKGTLHGFLSDRDKFTVIDVPGARATLVARMNAQGQIVGAYSEKANAVATDLPHGFLLKDGVFTRIDVPGAWQTQPFGINNRGQVVGRYVPAQGPVRGFLLDAGVFTTIVHPEVRGDTLVFDINDGGQLAGAYDLIRHGYREARRGAFTTIDHPDAVLTEELGGINNRGQIVGSYRDVTGTERGFLFDKKDFTSIEVPGAQLTVAHKINDHGQIVGAYTTNEVVRHGYLLDEGGLTTIDVPSALSTQAFDIDNRGQIVGEYQDAAGTFHGFLRDPDGNVTTIDVPGATATSITGINDRSQMIGLYGDAGGTLHAFLLDQGVVTTIDVPGAVLTFPFGLNNRAQVVGFYDDGVRGRSFMWENGAFTTPAVPPGTFGSALPLDIDDRGRIFGVYF